MVIFLLNVVDAIVAPFKRKRPSPPNAHRRFYKQGFMTNEIEALQSIFHNEDSQRTKKRK